MLFAAKGSSRNFPPTIYYNESWLLRLVIDWFSRRPKSSEVLSFFLGAKWYSECRLPSQFRAAKRGDENAEGWTHADGVIGHFTVGENALTNAVLNKDAKQFVVIEAKLFSRLATRVTKAAGFDQAARTVACVAEVRQLSP